jgi:peptidylprolyl isomerase
MTKEIAATGSTVTLNYTIQLENGTRVGGQKPMSMTFTIGGGEVFPVLEEAIIGMGVNQVCSVTVSPEQGYGDYDDSLVLQLERNAFPDDMPIIAGRTVQYQTRDGKRTNFVIQAVEGDRITVDGNHPLAGQTLIYELDVQKIE